MQASVNGQLYQLSGKVRVGMLIHFQDTGLVRRVSEVNGLDIRTNRFPPLIRRGQTAVTATSTKVN